MFYILYYNYDMIYYNVLYHTKLYTIILHLSTVYCIVLYYTILYSTGYLRAARGQGALARESDTMAMVSM